MTAPKSGPKVRAQPALATPTLNLAPRDVEGLMDELAAYPALFSPLFYRTEQRHWVQKYLEGLLRDIPRKSMEPMVLALEGPRAPVVRALQQFLGEGAWGDDAILVQPQRLVDVTPGGGERGYHRGSEWLPPARSAPGGGGPAVLWDPGQGGQLSGGVFLGYASAMGYTLIDRVWNFHLIEGSRTF